MNLLQNARFQYQLDRYLASNHLADAKILGFEKKYLNSLLHFGIVSAADVKKKRLYSLPPISGNNTKAKILEWRKNLERNFEFNPDTELPEADKNRFALQFVEKRGKIEKEIESLLVSLRSGALFLKQNQKRMAAESEILAQQLLQAEANAAAVGSNALLIVALISITGLIPLFGAAFQGNSSRNQTSNYPRINGKGSSPIYSANTATVTTNANTSIYTVEENLTDKQIEQMTASERKKSAESLLNQANELIAAGTSAAAEKKLRYAIRFEKNNTEILYALGMVLYEQRKYPESLKFLRQSFKLDSANEQTKILIGANYVEMRKFEDARQLFEEIIGENPESFEANFNLGQVYIGLKKYKEASVYFIDAATIKPDDADANYELGFCFFKSGDKEGAQEQYEILLNLNEDKAEKLRKLAGLTQIVNRVEKRQGIGTGTGYGTGYGSGTGSGR